MSDDVISLERVRALRDFEADEHVAYVEILWGQRGFAAHAAIRDLEAMRNGSEDPEKPLREPETTFEAQVLVDHIRWVANFLAAEWGLSDRVRVEDWRGDVRVKED